MMDPKVAYLGHLMRMISITLKSLSLIKTKELVQSNYGTATETNFLEWNFMILMKIQFAR